MDRTASFWGRLLPQDRGPSGEGLGGVEDSHRRM